MTGAANTWWASPEWLAYEAAGGYPSRVEELAKATWQTRVIDLSVSEAELWRGIRKSYKNLIRRVRTVHEALPAEVAVDCRVIHRQSVGYDTRPLETWLAMAEWVSQGNGLATISWAPCAYAYFIIDRGWSYYASAASLEPNVNHALIWHAMKALKARNVRWLELGWQGHAQDEKGKQIEFFRRGWGGFDVLAPEAPKLAFVELSP